MCCQVYAPRLLWMPHCQERKGREGIASTETDAPSLEGTRISALSLHMAYEVKARKSFCPPDWGASDSVDANTWLPPDWGAVPPSPEGTKCLAFSLDMLIQVAEACEVTYFTLLDSYLRYEYYLA